MDKAVKQLAGIFLMMAISLPFLQGCGGSSDDNPKFTTLEIIIHNSNGNEFSDPVDIKLYTSIEDWLINKAPVYETVLQPKSGVNDLLWTSQIVKAGIYLVDAHSVGTGQNLSNWESELRINVFGDQANTYTINVNVNQSYLLATGESSWELSEYFINGENILDSCNTSDQYDFSKGVRDGIYTYTPLSPICNPADTIESSGSWILRDATSTTISLNTGPFQGTFDFSVGQTALSIFRADSAKSESIKFLRNPLK